MMRETEDVEDQADHGGTSADTLHMTTRTTATSSHSAATTRAMGEQHEQDEQEQEPDHFWPFERGLTSRPPRRARGGAICASPVRDAPLSGARVDGWASTASSMRLRTQFVIGRRSASAIALAFSCNSSSSR